MTKSRFVKRWAMVVYCIKHLCICYGSAWSRGGKNIPAGRNHIKYTILDVVIWAAHCNLYAVRNGMVNDVSTHHIDSLYKCTVHNLGLFLSQNVRNACYKICCVFLTVYVFWLLVMGRWVMCQRLQVKIQQLWNPWKMNGSFGNGRWTNLFRIEI